MGCDYLAVGSAPTAIAVIGVDAAGENAIIVASGANLETAAAQVPEALLRPGATVLCQNEIRSAETFAVLARAKRLGARTVLNMAPAAAVPTECLGRWTCWWSTRSKLKRWLGSPVDRRRRRRGHLPPPTA